MTTISLNLIKSTPLKKIHDYPLRLFENLNTGTYEIYYGTYYAGKYDTFELATATYDKLLSELKINNN